jgi:hydroxymethylglutaryl-CoA lyase
MYSRTNRCFSSLIPSRVKIVEVGPRDGLQNESKFVATKDKITFITKLAEAGCSVIEPTAFVSPKWVPQMADSKEVMHGLATINMKGTTLSCLVPNLHGLERAIQAGCNEVAIFASASETFSQKNVNCSIGEAMERFQQVAQAAEELNVPLRGYVSCVLGCPYEGDISASKVASVAGQLAELGCHEISLGDTIGVGTPGSTVKILEATQV